MILTNQSWVCIVVFHDDGATTTEYPIVAWVARNPLCPDRMEPRTFADLDGKHWCYQYKRSDGVHVFHVRQPSGGTVEYADFQVARDATIALGFIS
jgi:hypothetical protein